MSMEDIADIFSGKTMPETALEALARWDDGKVVWTVSLGGLGPGYEQTIHCLVFEYIRDCASAPLPTANDYAQWGESTVTRVDPELGLSGAQAGMAKRFAYEVLSKGWKVAVEAFERDRRIQISDHWPHVTRRSADAEATN